MSSRLALRRKVTRRGEAETCPAGVREQRNPFASIGVTLAGGAAAPVVAAALERDTRGAPRVLGGPRRSPSWTLSRGGCSMPYLHCWTCRTLVFHAEIRLPELCPRCTD